MLAGWTRCELTATDNQAAKQQQPLVVFRKGTHQVRQELECVRMLFQTLGRARRCIAATKHGGVNEEIGQEWCAGRVRHGLQSAWPMGVRWRRQYTCAGSTRLTWRERYHKAIDESS